MAVIYPTVFTATHDKKDTYLVYIPDINGMTEGHGLEDAVNMARDYIGCTFYDKPVEQIPLPSDIADIDSSKSVFANEGESFVSLVDIDLEAYRQKMDNKPVRRNVSLPNWLNKKANEAHINVSRVLRDALIEKLSVKRDGSF